MLLNTFSILAVFLSFTLCQFVEEAPFRIMDFEHIVKASVTKKKVRGGVLDHVLDLAVYIKDPTLSQRLVEGIAIAYFRGSNFVGASEQDAGLGSLLLDPRILRMGRPEHKEDAKLMRSEKAGKTVLFLPKTEQYDTLGGHKRKAQSVRAKRKISKRTK